MIPEKFDYQKLQIELKKFQLDGWLAIDFKGRNEIALEVLGIEEAHITRRWFYWVPQTGQPMKLNHVIENHLLKDLEGQKSQFISYHQFCDALKSTLKGHKKIAIEYSPKGEIPSLSFIDGGILELLQSYGVEVVSSQNVLQPFLSVLSKEEIESQKRASLAAEEIMQKAWDWIRTNLSNNIREGDVQAFILQEFVEKGLATDWLPIVAINENSSLPHYTIENDGSYINKGDLLMIDLGCKEVNGIYADITRMACIGRKPTTIEQEIFDIVKEAQGLAIEYIRNTPHCTGASVDQVARSYIDSKGCGSHFLHRLGHNITSKPHGPGAHLDSLETLDNRELIPNTCFSIEPGIYLPNQFGIRLESTLLLLSNNQLLITGGIQKQFHII